MKGWKNIRVLLIDENKGDFQIFDQVSKEIGEFCISITWKKGYAEGRTALENETFDIIFIDNDLSKQPGIELLKCVQSCDPRPPAVLLTKKDQPELDSAALKAGATDYLAKEYLNRPILFRTIRHAIQRHQQSLRYEYQQQKFQGFFDQSMDGVFIVDTEWIAHDLNNKLRKMLSIDDSSTKPNIRPMLVPNKEWPRFSSLLSENDEVTNYPIRLEHHQDHIDLLISCRTIINTNQTIAGYQGIVRDITAFKKVENELAQVEQFNLTGRMARIIAHEVRNPLSNISLASDYLKEAKIKSHESFDTYMDIIVRNTNRIDDLIDGLLNSTKSSELVKNSLSVTKLVEAAVKFCEDRLTLKDIHVEISHLEKNQSIQGDFSKLTIALANLITNAIEAMDKTDHPHLRIESSGDESNILISVADNGIGMTQETKDSLFRPFYTKRHGGMGLGLSAVKHLVGQHEGVITFESVYQEGTIFTISIPRQ